MSKKEIIAEMRELSERMLDVATKMDYFGGINSEIALHAQELAGASAILLTWADGMEQEA